MSEERTGSRKTRQSRAAPRASRISSPLARNQERGTRGAARFPLRTQLRPAHIPGGRLFQIVIVVPLKQLCMANLPFRHGQEDGAGWPFFSWMASRFPAIHAEIVVRIAAGLYLADAFSFESAGSLQPLVPTRATDAFKFPFNDELFPVARRPRRAYRL